MNKDAAPETWSEKLPSSPKSRGTSPLWNRALERYKEALGGDDDDDEILASAGSLEDLVDYARSLEPQGTNSLGTLNRLLPTLKFVDDFSAVVAICLGASTKVTAFAWGSLRLIISLASTADDVLQQALDMLEEISLSLPRLRRYEQTLPVDRSFENALIDLYSEILCFYARLIRHYKANPHLAMQRAGWQTFQKDFASTVRRVKHFSTVVEKEADVARMKLETHKYEEVLEALKGLGGRSAPVKQFEHCWFIPASMSNRFRERQAELGAIKQALDPSEASPELRTFALYGMGGVGKTQLALRYTLESKKLFDTILWIAADTRMSLESSFRDAAEALGLSQGSNDGTTNLSAVVRVKDWLSDSRNGRSWLIVFDNADDISILRHVWPANSEGSVLLTSRDSSSASVVASRGLNLQPFDNAQGGDVLIQLLNLSAPDVSQREEASRICHQLGGLPLALDQIAGFITQRRLRIEEFLALYHRNSTKIDARKQGFGDYQHTLATVFKMSLDNLSGDALHLQNLVAFLEPDRIHESIFEDGAGLVKDLDFGFLADEMDLGDAEEALLQAALINKDAADRSLSVHRLIQKAALRRLDNSEKRKYFAALVKLLCFGFPETWSKDVGHQKSEWARCERYLPHVNNLVTIASVTPALVSHPDEWADLLLRCSWYLYEKEEYMYTRLFTREALNSFTDKQTLAYASAIDLLGLVDLDLHRPEDALRSFETGVSVRQAMLPISDPLIAFAFNNLALAYTELSELERAKEYHQKAIEIRKLNKSDRIGNSYSNYAVTLLRMGRGDEAEDILMRCPSLQGCTDETFLDADNPRFVGDMVLLSRIRKAQGRTDEAMRLAGKALSWREKTHGDRFKTCDSAYDVACLLYEEGKDAVALEALGKVSRTAETLEGGEGHAARAQWKMSRIFRAQGKETLADEHLNTAVSLSERFRPDMDRAVMDDESWEHGLTPYMLW